MTRLQYKDVYQDAGLYRQWLAENYGSYFAEGGDPTIAGHGLRHAIRLSSMTGLPLEEIVNAVIDDYTSSHQPTN